MTHTHGRAGAPLVALALLLAGWVALRLAFWSPLAPVNAASATPFIGGQIVAAERAEVDHSVGGTSDPGDAVQVEARFRSRLPTEPSRRKLFAPLSLWKVSANVIHSQPKTLHPAFILHPSIAAEMNDRQAAPPLPVTHARDFDGLPPSVLSATNPLSLDAWVFLREGTRAGSALAPRPASLGASQIGVVARYALVPRHPLRPAAYVRVSRDVAASGDSEAAGGLTVRPFGTAPVAAHAELRVTRQNGELEVRPAAFVTAGFDRQPVVVGVEARGYAQAGYVGGRHATGFADGQVVAEREVAETPAGAVRVGVGTWGGVQKGAARLDVGPSASVELQVAGAPVRVEANYRIQIAGAAQPDSGFAVTLATGF